MILLLTLDVLELPYAGGDNEVELLCFFGQGLEDQGEAQLLVGPGNLCGCRGHGDVLRTYQLQLAAFISLDIAFSLDIPALIHATGFNLHLEACLRV